MHADSFLPQKWARLWRFLFLRPPSLFFSFGEIQTVTEPRTITSLSLLNLLSFFCCRLLSTVPLLLAAQREPDPLRIRKSSWRNPTAITDRKQSLPGLPFISIFFLHSLGPLLRCIFFFVSPCSFVNLGSLFITLFSLLGKIRWEVGGAAIYGLNRCQRKRSPHVD